MYPKKSSSSVKSNKENSRMREREQLRSLITQKLGEKYSQQPSQVIEKEVNRMMEGTQDGKLTKSGLEQLESRLAGSNKPSRAMSQASEHDRLSVKSGLSKMSGATQFDNFDKYQSYKEEDKQSVVSGKSRKKILNMNQQRETDDLSFLDENNQWAAIMKYNNYMFKKEEHFKKIRGQQQKKEFKSDLDEQIRLKKQRQHQEMEVEQKYIDNMRRQLGVEDEREQVKINASKRKIELEKIERQKQMKDIKQRRRRDLREEKHTDQFYLQKLQDEMEKEAQYNVVKKVHQKQVTQKLMVENQEKQEMVKEMAERERLERIELMDTYIKLVNEQEAKREQDLQKREDKIAAISQQHKGVIVDEQQVKIQKVMDRHQKYEDRKEKKRAKQEDKRLADRAVAIQDNKNYLFRQMDERVDKQQAEVGQKREQAAMWRTDEEKFNANEDNIKTMRGTIMKEYKGHLEQQMDINKRSRQDMQLLGVMSEQEQLLNKHLNNEIVGLRQTLHQ